MYCHIDADSFFASVLQRKNPRLKGKPLLALGMGGGMVIAASYDAKAKGVKTGMPLREAKHLCPEALAIPSDFAETGMASKQIEEFLRTVAPIVEKMSIDEWYLDLRTLRGGIPADCSAWAWKIKEDVERATDISVSIGIAPTKILAKMASEYRKPGGVTVVMQHTNKIAVPGNPKESILDLTAFLQNRPAAAIPGIGHKRQVHTNSHGWKTAWDIAHADPETIIHLFGRPGHELQQELLGHAVNHVTEDNRPPKSVSRCRSFHAEYRQTILWAHAIVHMQRLVLKMRQHNLAAFELGLWLRTTAPFFYDASHVRLPQPLDNEEKITSHLKRCFEKAQRKGQMYTQIGVIFTSLVPRTAEQLSFFEDQKLSQEAQKLQISLDGIRSRFGKTAIMKASALPVQSKSHGMDSIFLEPT